MTSRWGLLAVPLWLRGRLPQAGCSATGRSTHWVVLLAQVTVPCRATLLLLTRLRAARVLLPPLFAAISPASAFCVAPPLSPWRLLSGGCTVACDARTARLRLVSASSKHAQKEFVSLGLFSLRFGHWLAAATLRLIPCPCKSATGHV